MDETAEPAEIARRPGRPRKWADDAERARAYRARRAEELMAPEQLRADRRRLERQVRDLTGQLERERRRAAGLDDELASARAEIYRLSRAAAPARGVVEQHQATAPVTRIEPNRAQRRAAAKRRR